MPNYDFDPTKQYRVRVRTIYHEYDGSEAFIHSDPFEFGPPPVPVDDWSPKTWNGFIPYDGRYIWTDGTDIYYSDGSSRQYILDKATSTWNSKTWNYANLYGSDIWTDGTDIYYSPGSNIHKVLNKSTGNWDNKIWNGFTDFSSYNIWTDGTDIYYSNSEYDYDLEEYVNTHYVLDKATSTWNSKTWNNEYFSGSGIWTDGTDIYYSNSEYDSDLEEYVNTHYVLNEATSTWNSKTWNNEYFSGSGIWTDGTDIYYSTSYNGYYGTYVNYVLDKVNDTWNNKTWTGGLTNISRGCIWTDGTDIYYSNYDGGFIEYVLNKE